MRPTTCLVGCVVQKYMYINICYKDWFQIGIFAKIIFTKSFYFRILAAVLDNKNKDKKIKIYVFLFVKKKKKWSVLFWKRLIIIEKYCCRFWISMIQFFKKRIEMNNYLVEWSYQRSILRYCFTKSAFSLQNLPLLWTKVFL